MGDFDQIFDAPVDQNTLPPPSVRRSDEMEQMLVDALIELGEISGHDGGPLQVVVEFAKPQEQG